MQKLNENWRKSTRSNNNGACVEVRRINGTVHVRDTKDGGAGPILSFSEQEWAAFIGGTQDGEFNL